MAVLLRAVWFTTLVCVTLAASYILWQLFFRRFLSSNSRAVFNSSALCEEIDNFVKLCFSSLLQCFLLSFCKLLTAKPTDRQKPHTCRDRRSHHPKRSLSHCMWTYFNPVWYRKEDDGTSLIGLPVYLNSQYQGDKNNNNKEQIQQTAISQTARFFFLFGGRSPGQLSMVIAAIIAIRSPGQLIAE